MRSFWTYIAYFHVLTSHVTVFTHNLLTHSDWISLSTRPIIIIIIIVIITKSHSNYCSVGVMELCLLNVLILIDCFLCNSYPCMLFESLSHVINQESHVYSWNLWKIYLVHFLKFWHLPRFTSEISKFQKNELGKFIPNFPLKHVITTCDYCYEHLLMTVSGLWG